MIRAPFSQVSFISRIISVPLYTGSATRIFGDTAAVFTNPYSMLFTPFNHVFQIFHIKSIRGIAEMTFYLNRLPILHHLIQILSSYADQRLFHMFPAAVAVELCIHLVMDLQTELTQDLCEQLLRCKSTIQV